MCSALNEYEAKSEIRSKLKTSLVLKDLRRCIEKTRPYMINEMDEDVIHKLARKSSYPYKLVEARVKEVVDSFWRNYPFKPSPTETYCFIYNESFLKEVKLAFDFEIEFNKDLGD